MKFRIVKLAGLVGLACLSLSAQNLTKSLAALSGHNINSSGCVTCHAPHNGSNQTNGAADTTGQYLLWALSLPTPTAGQFGSYLSPSLTGLGLVPASIDGGIPVASGGSSPDPMLYSLICLSCHDGVSSPSVMATVPADQVGLGPGKQNGLANDHPINVAYDATADTFLNAVGSKNTIPAVSGTTGTLLLYPRGTALTVQCSSCHDPHNDTANGKFMRQQIGTVAVSSGGVVSVTRTNAEAAHCLSCHK